MRKSNPLKVMRHSERRLHRYSISEGNIEYGIVYVTDPDHIVAKSRSRKGLRCKRA